jgi:hypothetical protein
VLCIKYFFIYIASTLYDPFLIIGFNMKEAKIFALRLYRLFTIGMCTGILTLTGLSMSGTANILARESSATHCHAFNLQESALALEARFWKRVQRQDVEGFSKCIASIYQGSGPDGINTRDQFIQGLTNATLPNFTLKNLVAKQSRDLLVISYQFIAPGSNLVSGPTISVWQASNHRWKMISHSYLEANTEKI